MEDVIAVLLWSQERTFINMIPKIIRSRKIRLPLLQSMLLGSFLNLGALFNRSEV